MPSSSLADELESLRQQIRHHDDLYYQKAQPEISDKAYDALLKELLELEAAHPELVTPDSPSQRVGGKPIDGFASVTHAIRMMSIDNTYDETEVREFDTRVRKLLAAEGSGGGRSYVYLVSPRLTGCRCRCAMKMACC